MLILLGFFFVWMVKQTRFLEMDSTGSVPKLMVEFIPTRPSSLITCFSNLGRVFPECRNCKTTSNKWKISNLCSLTLLQTLRHHCGLLDTQSSPALEAPSLCLLKKGNKTVTAHQNLRAAAAPGAIRHCQDLPGVDIH